MTAPRTNGRTSLGELARLFLKLGTVAFGGPAAHIAMMREEVVRRRDWLTEAEFLDYLGATNLIPGPNSTELAIHVGHARGGWRGLLVAGACFIFPAALIVGIIAWAYVRYGQLPAIVDVFAGVKPVVIAIVLQALWALGRTAVKSRPLAILGLAALGASAAGINELIVLLATGIAAWVVGIGARRLSPPRAVAGLALPVVGVGAVAGAVAAAPLSILFVTFLKIGAVLFGSGYVLLAFLRADFVQRLGWLTERQLLDAVAVGQVTPGPVFTTATFVGALTAGWRGAIVATAGIFLPAFVFVALSGPLVPRLRRSAAAGAVLDGVNVASLALMAVVTWQLARAAVVDLPTAGGIALVSLILLLRFRANSAWLVGGGALAGLLLPR